MNVGHTVAPLLAFAASLSGYHHAMKPTEAAAPSHLLKDDPRANWERLMSRPYPPPGGKQLQREYEEEYTRRKAEDRLSPAQQRAERRATKKERERQEKKERKHQKHQKQQQEEAHAQAIGGALFGGLAGILGSRRLKRSPSPPSDTISSTTPPDDSSQPSDTISSTAPPDDSSPPLPPHPTEAAKGKGKGKNKGPPPPGKQTAKLVGIEGKQAAKLAGTAKLVVLDEKHEKLVPCGRIKCVQDFVATHGNKYENKEAAWQKASELCRTLVKITGEKDIVKATNICHKLVDRFSHILHDAAARVIEYKNSPEFWTGLLGLLEKDRLKFLSPDSKLKLTNVTSHDPYTDLQNLLVEYPYALFMLIKPLGIGNFFGNRMQEYSKPPYCTDLGYIRDPLYEGIYSDPENLLAKKKRCVPKVEYIKQAINKTLVDLSRKSSSEILASSIEGAQQQPKEFRTKLEKPEVINILKLMGFDTKPPYPQNVLVSASKLTLVKHGAVAGIYLVAKTLHKCADAYLKQHAADNNSELTAVARGVVTITEHVLRNMHSQLLPPDYSFRYDFGPILSLFNSTLTTRHGRKKSEEKYSHARDILQLSSTGGIERSLKPLDSAVKMAYTLDSCKTSKPDNTPPLSDQEIEQALVGFSFLQEAWDTLVADPDSRMNLCLPSHML